MHSSLLAALLCIVPVAVQGMDFDSNDMLSAHNRWRSAVGVPPLLYSYALAGDAQHWANHLQQSLQCKMRHSQPDGQYGENLYWGSAISWSDGRRELQNVSPAKVVDAWASERVNYNHESNTCLSGKVCGHYTQLVWKNTTEVGCAVAICSDTQEQIWVCRYLPAGNWIGESPY